MVKYKIWVHNHPIIVQKQENGLYMDILTLNLYIPTEVEKVEQINDCADCLHVSTPKGKQCYTISRMIKEKIRDNALPLDPRILIPFLDQLGETCKRYELKVGVAQI